MSETLGRLVVELQANVAQFNTNVARTEARLARSATKMQRDVKGVDTSFAGLTRSAMSLASSMPLVGAALGGLSVGALVSSVRQAIDAVGGLGELADQAGVSTDALQALTFAGVEVGVGAEQMQKALERLTRTIGDAAAGNETAASAFSTLGVAIIGANGEARSTEAVLADVADKIAGITNPAERAAAATEIFGDRIGQSLLPFLMQGSAGLERLTREAVEFGAVADADLIATADRASDALAKLQLTFSTLTRNMMAEVAPALTVVVDLLDRIVRSQRGAAPAALLSGYRAELQDLADQIDGPAAARGQGPSSIQLAQMSARASFLRSEIARLAPLASQSEARVQAAMGRTPPAAGAPDDIPLPPPDAPRVPASRASGRSSSGARAQFGPTDAEARAHIATQEASVAAMNEYTTGLNLQAAGLEAAAGVLQRYQRDMETLETALSLGTITQDEFNASVEASSVALNTSIEAAQQRGQQTVDLGRELGRILPGAFEDAATSGKAFGDVLTSLGEDLAKLILRMTIMVPLANSLTNLLGGSGGKGGGGILSSIGSSIGGMFSGTVAKAGGGSVTAGMAYSVGERGRELFVPQTSGRIIPNGGMGGTTFAPSFNIDARGSDSSILPRVEAIARAAAAQSLAQFSDSIRRGGPAARLVGR